MKTKEKLKQIKYRIESLFFIIQRTLLSSFYKIKFPINKEVHCDSHVKIGRGTMIYFYNGKMHIKENTTICNNSKFIIGGGKLEIGKNCLLGEYGIYNTFANLIIEDDVITADRISFVTNIHQYHDIEIPIKDQPSTSDDIVIGRGTWIGMNATILGGTHIGKNVVIAAHSVVKGDFPDYCVCGGVPAHIIRQYNIKIGKWEKPYNK